MKGVYIHTDPFTNKRNINYLCQKWQTVHQVIALHSGPKLVKMQLVAFSFFIKEHSVLTGCMIIFEIPVTLSLFIKSSIDTCRTDMCQIIKHLHQKISGRIDLLKSTWKEFSSCWNHNTLWEVMKSYCYCKHRKSIMYADARWNSLFKKEFTIF